MFIMLSFLSALKHDVGYCCDRALCLSFPLAMDLNDDMGLDDQVEQEERERSFLLKEEHERALQHEAAFTGKVSILAESCASTNASSSPKSVQNPSSASVWQRSPRVGMRRGRCP